MPTKEEIQARYLRGEINKTTYDELLNRLRAHQEALKRETLDALKRGVNYQRKPSSNTVIETAT